MILTDFVLNCFGVFTQVVEKPINNITNLHFYNCTIITPKSQKSKAQKQQTHVDKVVHAFVVCKKKENDLHHPVYFYTWQSCLSFILSCIL